MLNPAANGESVQVFSSYAEEYLELVESLPLDLQRCVSLMREIDAKYQGGFNHLEQEIFTELSLSATCSSCRQTNKQTNSRELPAC